MIRSPAANVRSIVGLFLRWPRSGDKKEKTLVTHADPKSMPIMMLRRGFLCLIIATLAGCTQSAQRSYRIGLGPWVGFGPFYLARDKGFFQEAGINADLIVLTGLAERNSALKSGRIDALAAPVDYFVLSAGNRLETTVVMAVDESVGGDGIVARKDITKVEDLRGKRVAFQHGLPAEFFLRALLQQNKVSLKDVQVTDLQTADAGAAFIAGKVDAAVVWEPWLTRATDEGNGHVLASTKDYPDLIVDCLAFNKDVVTRAPEDVQKIVNVVLRAIEYWKQHTEESNRIMAPYFELDAAKYAAVLSGARFADLSRNKQYFGTANNPGPIFEVARKASDLWQEGKVIEAPVAPPTIISTKFVEQGSN
jgi:NitT/TauT family transport system substrate-binding protein